MNDAENSDSGKMLAPDGRTYEEIARKCKMTVVQVEKYYEKMKRLVENTGIPIAPPDDPILKKRTAIISTVKKPGTGVA